MPNRAVKVRIEGKVQGVWYRAWTEETANGLGLHGWVSNLPDGAVQAVFYGGTDDVARMLENCRHGPPLAKVTHIEAQDCDPPRSSGFEIRRAS